MGIEMKMIGIDEITPNPLQPREAFDREKLREMADTVSEVGVLQPIVVRPKGKIYEIIAGERRWKASQIVGKKEIPALVKDVPDEEVMVQSLIENVHREDLKPIEQARAILEVFKAQEKNFSKKFIDDRLPQKINIIDLKLREKYKGSNKLTEEEEILSQIVKKVGLKHHAIYESLILLKLPKTIQEEATEKEIGKMELARIAAIEDEETQKKVFRKVADEDLSYEKTAKLVSIVKKAPKPVREAILKKEAKITPEIAEKIIKEFPEEEQQEVIIKEIERYKDLGEKGIEAHIEERARIARGEKGPELHVSADPNERLVEHCRRVSIDVTTIQAHHALSMPEKWKREYIRYMKMMHDHLEKELAELGEIKYIEARGG